MPKSVSTRQSGSTVRTTSDVLDLLEQQTKGLSLAETRKAIKKTTKNDTSLAAQTIKEIQSPLTMFSSISSVPDALVKLLSETNTYLGGLQATSYFFPICNIMDAPWDFFCSSTYGNPQVLIGKLHIITGSELLENMVSANEDYKVLIYRRAVNGTEEPITIRVFISTKHPIESILNLKTTQQQSFMSCAGAVCFWPKLLQAKKKKSKAFSENGGLSIYPTGETKYRNRHSKLYPMEIPLATSLQIHVGLTETEYILFENEANIPDAKFRVISNELRDIVYAVSNNATRYLGNVNGM